MSAATHTPGTVEPAANRDGSITWIARGISAGIPYIAEGDTEADAVAQAVTLVFQRHAVRQLRALSGQQGQSHTARR